VTCTFFLPKEILPLFPIAQPAAEAKDPVVDVSQKSTENTRVFFPHQNTIGGNIGVCKENAKSMSGSGSGADGGRVVCGCDKRTWMIVMVGRVVHMIGFRMRACNELGQTSTSGIGPGPRRWCPLKSPPGAVALCLRRTPRAPERRPRTCHRAAVRAPGRCAQPAPRRTPPEPPGTPRDLARGPAGSAAKCDFFQAWDLVSRSVS